MIEERDTYKAYGSHGSEVPRLRRNFDDIMDFAMSAKAGSNDYSSTYGLFGGEGFYDGFTGAKSWAEIETLARDGWDKDLQETLELSERAVQVVEREIEQFEPHFSVTGMDVDIASAVAGLPEDMIDYPLTRVSNVGSTVIVCCDVQCTAAVSAKSVARRGQVLVALALALEACQHQTELWLSDEYTDGRSRVVFRTLVKGPNDFIDPMKIMYAYAHPSVQRGLGFCAVAGLPKPFCNIARNGYGPVSSVTKDMPEGTLYIEPLFRYSDSPNLDVELRMYLAQLGLLSDEDLNA